MTIFDPQHDPVTPDTVYDRTFAWGRWQGIPYPAWMKKSRCRLIRNMQGTHRPAPNGSIVIEFENGHRLMTYFRAVRKIKE
jgi:hypothetical protein